MGTSTAGATCSSITKHRETAGQNREYAEHLPNQTLTEQERHVIGLITIKCSPLQMSLLLVCIKNLRRRLYTKLTGRDGSDLDSVELLGGCYICRGYKGY